MYNIDAFDVNAQQATSTTAENEKQALSKAATLAKTWKEVEVRNVTYYGSVTIASWLDGKRQA